MPATLKAEDLLPLALRLSPRERARLARKLLAQPAATAVVADDAAKYRAKPVGPDEFGREEVDFMAIDADGWEPFYAPR